MVVLKQLQRVVAKALGSEDEVSCIRCNKAAAGSVDRSFVFGEGSFKIVYRGQYTDGCRRGQLYVSKEMRIGPSYVDTVFDHELNIVHKANQIIQQFNDLKIASRPVQLNNPEVWKYARASHPDIALSRALVEPYIKNFAKFNSNTGWVPACYGEEGMWVEVLQALSHFSYHASGGKYLLCDLQGAVYRSKLVLTDPVILSVDSRYGPTDLGQKGIEQFFHFHKCSGLCQEHWGLPRRTRKHFPVRDGTSMSFRNGQWIMPTRMDRPLLTSLSE